VERLLQVLPSKLRDLISDTTFIVLIADASQATFNSFIDGDSKRHVDTAWMQAAYRPVHESQVPFLIPSPSDEVRFLDLHHWLAINESGTADGSAYILPLSTGHRRLGVVCALRRNRNTYSPDEISSLTLATQFAASAVDSRLNFAASEEARLQLESEQTRLRLILDLNHSVVSNLDLKQLIRAMSPGIRNAMQLDAVALMLPAGDRLRLVDLNEVTLIDRCGEEVLLQMVHQHARLVASDMYTRHVIENLQTRDASEDQDPIQLS
jgi:formate hydrogenlyase transcriptional activator